MNEEAKLELELRYRLYELYLNTSIKGTAFFIAIQGALLTLAAQNKEVQSMISFAALAMCLATLIPLLGSIKILKKAESDFDRLAEQTQTNAIEVRPVWIFWLGAMVFWLFCMIGWIYAYYAAN